MRGAGDICQRLRRRFSTAWVITFVILLACSGLFLVLFVKLTRPQTKNLDFITRLQPAQAITVAENHLYAVRSDGNFVVYDISNPKQPSQLGSLALQAEMVFDICADHPYVYVAAREAGLRVLDVSNPADPLEIGSFDETSVAAVMVIDDYVYVDSPNGLLILDVSNPAVPVEVGLYKKITDINNIVMKGNYVYLSGGRGLRILDATNPKDPVEFSFCCGTRSWRVSVVGNYAYLVNGDSGLQVVDVSNPASPKQVAVYDRLNWVVNVAAEDRYVFASQSVYDTPCLLPNCHHGKMVMFDVSNPQNLVEAGSAEVGGSLAIVGDCVYVANLERGLFVLCHPD